MRVIKVSGTTRSGKTKLSMELANRFANSVKFISSDTMTESAMRIAVENNFTSFKTCQYAKTTDELFDDFGDLVDTDCIVIDMISLFKTDNDQPLDDFIKSIIDKLSENIKLLVVNYQLPRSTSFELSAIEVQM